MSKKKIIIATILITFVIGLFCFYQHRQLQEAISTERERVNRVRFVISQLGGKTTIWEEGFPHIEYNLVTNRAIINLAGLYAKYSMNQTEVIEALFDKNHPKQGVVYNFIQLCQHSGSTMYMQVLTEIWLDDFLYLQSQFSELDLEIFMNTLTMPTSVLKELIRLEAEQR